MPDAPLTPFAPALAFRKKVRSRAVLCGSFVKTPTPQIVEILALAGFDFLVLDAEHAPFDRAALDLCILAGRATNTPVLVRAPTGAPAMIAASLDAGAAGIIAPHMSAAAARTIAAEMRFDVDGRRGLSPAPRAGGYGAISFPEFSAQSDASVTLWAQIEDRKAADEADAIASVEGVDCLFVGRVDLAHALGETSIKAASVEQVTDKSIDAALQAGRAAALFVNEPAEIGAFREKGVSVFAYGADQSLLRGAAAEAVAACREAADA